LGGTNGFPDKLITAVCSYFRPSDKSNPIEQEKSVLGVIEIGTWLATNNYYGADLEKLYKFVNQDMVIDSDRVHKFIMHCQGKLDEQLRTEEIVAIMDVFFKRETPSNKNLADNLVETLRFENNDPLAINNLCTKVHNLMHKYHTFRLEGTTLSYRSYVVALLLIRDPITMDTISESYIKETQAKEFSTKGLVRHVLQRQALQITDLATQIEKQHVDLDNPEPKKKNKGKTKKQH